MWLEIGLLHIFKAGEMFMVHMYHKDIQGTRS